MNAKSVVNIFLLSLILLSACAPAAKETPLSAGCAKSIRERQKIFDLTTYDRLRVVTTELRRLVCEGRIIELRLGPVAILCNRQLAKLLPWV